MITSDSNGPLARRRAVAAIGLGLALLLAAPFVPAAEPPGYVVNDAHFHLTNYVQEGTDIRDFLKIMGDKVGRVAIFGIPLQQT